MVVNFGETEIFEGKMPQPLHRVVGRNLTSPYLLKKLADGIRVHAHSRHALVSVPFRRSNYQDGVCFTGEPFHGQRRSLCQRSGVFYAGFRLLADLRCVTVFGLRILLATAKYVSRALPGTLRLR